MTGNYKVVCVDDNEDILTLYQEVLSSLQYEVVTFSVPEDASSYIKENHRSIVFIFSDFEMNSMNGFQLREKIISYASMVPFAIVTGFHDKELAVRAMELNVCSFIDKPFDEEAILTLIKAHGERRIIGIQEEHEMVCSFLEESSPMLEEIEELILVLEKDPGNTQALNTYFRLLHTIKGTSSCLGLISIPDFTHKYEDLVSILKSGEQVVTKGVIDVLLKGLDFLKLMYGTALQGKNPDLEIIEAIKIFDHDFSKEKKLEPSKEKESATNSNFSIQEKITNEDEKINISVSILDQFLQQSGEMTVLKNTVLKSAGKLEQKFYGDKDVDFLAESLGELHKVSSQMQTAISEIRKVGIDATFKPMKRVVRDASRNLGKEIEIEFTTNNLKIDTSIAKVLNNILIHLVRNGVDHGVEMPLEREASGKDAKGQIKISSIEDGENIVITLEDDGRGMDPLKLKEKALEKGLFDEQALQNMPDHRIFALIFDSGFSTAQEVTDISGRGVGMDMVKSSVEGAGGRIHIDSKLGRGSKFVIVLPIPRSVLIVHSLMVKTAGITFCLPIDDIAEIVSIDIDNSERVEKIEGKLILRREGKLVPLISLREVIREKENVCSDSNICKVVVVRGEGFIYGVMVDVVLDIEEVVTKELSPMFKGVKYASGCSFVEDGGLAIIIDLKGLAAMSGIPIMQDEENDFFDKKESGDFNQVEFMQFKLSNQPYCAFDLEHVNRLEEIDKNIIELSGDIPLIKYRNDFMPLLWLEGMLGFTERTYEDFLEKKSILQLIVCSKDSKRVGVIVDKIQDIGKSDSELSSINVDRDGLLGTVFIADKTVTVIDADYIIENYKEMIVAMAEKSLSSPEDLSAETQVAA